MSGIMLHQLNEHGQELSCQLYLNKAEKKKKELSAIITIIDLPNDSFDSSVKISYI